MLGQVLTLRALGQVLVAERGPLIMVANFSPDQYHEDLKVRPAASRCQLAETYP